MSSSVSISQDFIKLIRLIYDQSLDYILTGNGPRYGINAYSPYALPSYILAVSAIEAFMSEVLLSGISESLYKESALWKFGPQRLNKLSVNDRVLIFSELLFSYSFDISAQPFQDFELLVKIRNKITHYDATPKEPPKFQKALCDKGIFLKHKIKDNKHYNPWAMDASCTEGIRWAHNTMCSIVNTIFDNAPKMDDSPASDIFTFSRGNYTPISENIIKEFLTKNGFDFTKNHPSKS